MNKALGVYIVSLALNGACFFPVALLSNAVAEIIGDAVAPKQDHVLIGIPCMIVGIGSLGLLALGVIFRHAPAMRASALAFIGAAAGYLWMALRGGAYQPWSERLISLLVLGICFGGAAYVWHLARERSTEFPDESVK